MAGPDSENRKEKEKTVMSKKMKEQDSKWNTSYVATPTNLSGVFIIS